nr:hypothetical protein [Mycoplasmopsis bovis]
MKMFDLSNINLINKIQRVLDNAIGGLNWEFNKKTGWLKTFNSQSNLQIIRDEKEEIV